ncbi:hypothetical protein CBR_g31073 [Chara braunii]|uniref:Thioredoxin-dependent peroxiredoxin Q n=1 Tax=Chara braunii TaxID=69332 RepID=A0A388LEH1_CHABU|nr:hypothetical protein CBR_g31073 [Chara braunii]|eukprot:GBG80613.1 hypothetical protein CBR_g31073 [Chara braunii]
MVVNDYLQDVECSFSYAGGELRHRVSFLVSDKLPMDMLLGMYYLSVAQPQFDWDRKLVKHTLPGGGTARLRKFKASSLIGSHGCMCATAFYNYYKQNQEEGMYLVYVSAAGEPVKMSPEVEGVVAKYPDLFEEPTGVVEREVVHAIEIIPGSSIPKGRIYWMSPGELDELRRQLKEIVEKGLLEGQATYSGSSWAPEAPPIPERPGESLSMDFMNTLVTSKSGMRYIYAIVDRFSKFARLVAMSATTKTEYVIKMFKENWVSDFGLPKSIVSDRDVRFTSELWKAAAAEQGTQLQMTSGNHPEANGQAEEMNRVACAFRDAYQDLRRAGAVVIGVSSDSPESHKEFAKKYDLPYVLLSDEGGEARKEWGVPGDLFGILPGRQTYVIDKKGIVQMVFNNQFQPEKHVDEALKILTA